ncbi:MAG: AAA family ATPase [Coriobacteriales bacterium]|jgi:predicted AAA+ superfamily ATPase|nr:AAA family ATPase [Coriobacteriales bacterium]
MQRKIYHKLLAWKQAGAAKPLMIIGARQTGKTYTVSQFAAREFPQSVYFNLFDRKDVVELFDANINTQEKIDRLALLAGHPIDFKNTLLFIDEIQESEKAIEAMKFFCEAKEHYNVVCAGSLLGVKLKRFSGSFPVGKVSLLHMYPMDFEEYLIAAGESLLATHIRECLGNNLPVMAPLHEKCLGLLRRYLCVGGLPEAVAQLLARDNDVLRFDRLLPANLVESYIADMSKYVKNPQESARVEAVYRSIPSQLGNRSHKFQYAKIRSGAKGRDYGSAIHWLTASEMVHQCFCASLPQKPLKGFADPQVFKLFLNDPGLLCSLAGIDFLDVMLDKPFTYKGILTESYVAGQLVAAGIPLMYWRNENTAEVDFLLENSKGVVPLEAKAGTNKKTQSLRVYQTLYKPSLSIRTTARNFGLANQIRSVPLYALFALPQALLV